jgi:hypothetical protein
MKIRRKATISLIRKLLPEKYFDDMYFSKLLNKDNLKILNLKQIIWCSIHGFLPFEYKWYELDKNDYRNYLNALNNFKNRKLNGSYNAILGNKILFEKHIKNIIGGIEKLFVIESIAFIEKGILKPLDKKIICNDFSSLIPFLEKNDLILKPILGDGGFGLFKITKEGDHFLINHKKVSWNDLIINLQNLDNYLIQEKFHQHGFSHDIYAGSVNTMRIGTMIDPETNEPFIAYALHRFGFTNSGFVDNVLQGGLISMIDVADGKLSRVIFLSENGDKTSYDQHPISTKQIYNEYIPNWNDLVGRILEMAKRLPYLKYVGWDIILSDDDLYVLEGNVSPGTGYQLFKSLKEYPLVWKFFKHYKYI